MGDFISREKKINDLDAKSLAKKVEMNRNITLNQIKKIDPSQFVDIVTNVVVIEPTKPTFFSKLREGFKNFFKIF